MPALVTCRGNKVLEKRWNVGSDDFVLPAFLSMVNGVFVIALIVAVLLTFFLVPGCQHITIPLIVYCSFSTLLVVEFATAIDEAVIFSKSSRGPILLSDTKPNPRKTVGRYIHVRIVLAIVEGLNILACTVAISIPSVKHILESCPGLKIALSFAIAVIVVLWVLFAGFLVKSLLYTDPLGIFTPGLLQHLTFFDHSDDDGEIAQSFEEERRDSLTVPQPVPGGPGDFRLGVPSRRRRERDESGGEFSVRYWHRPRRLHIHSGDSSDPTPVDIHRFQKQHSVVHRAHLGQRRIRRRLQALFCCLGIGGHRSRGIALEDVARGLYTMFDFDDIDLVLSDVIAGLVLVSHDQARKKKKKQSLVKKFRDMTFSVMPTNQKPAGSIDHHPPKPFDFSDVDERLLFDNLLHYMKYAVGVYGWPLHVFTYPCCGLCELCCVTCCVCNYRCCNKRGFTDFLEEDCCMCGVGAMKLEAEIKEEDILFVSHQNQIYQAPFTVCVDRNMHAVVVSVRGTLSIKDTLTDMSFSPKYIPVSGRNETYVHGGMYRAAFEICKILKEKNSEGKGVLEEAFETHKGYKLVITGHSLGAGVASVLALLLLPAYPQLVCYAYSPPGCICSFPLVEYTKKFITSVVLGNDIVPRLSFRSLLYLKYSLRHVLKKCTIPKYQVLFRPRWFDKLPFCRSDTCMDGTAGAELEEDIASQVVNEKTTLRGLENALFTPTGPPRKLASQSSTSEEPSSHSQQPLRYLSKQQSTKQQPPRLSGTTRQESVTPVAIEGILEHCRARDRDQFMPAFPPGKLLHIEVEKNAKPCCLGCCYPNEMKVSEICNEDLCVITVDRGTIDDHLPNNVLNALKCCKQQFMDSVYNPEEVRERRRRKSRDRRKEQEARDRTDQKTGFVFPDRSSLTASVTPADAGIPQISVTMEGEAGEGRGGRVIEGRGGGVTEEQVSALVGRGDTRLEGGERKTDASPLATIPEERSRSPSPTSSPTVVVQAEVCPDAGTRTNYHSDLEMRATQKYATDISVKNQEATLRSQQGVDVDNSCSAQPLTIPLRDLSDSPDPTIQSRAKEAEEGGGGAEGGGGGEKGEIKKKKKRPHLKLKLERHVAIDLEEVIEGVGDSHDNTTKEEELHGSNIRLHVAEQVNSETTL